ncbi:MAG: glycosyltransferase [Methylobacter sp.]|uniref:glycosyltransferase n=1 Tax=Methylobacter sp. TaxID=2051955 RepID=UPI002586BBB6|nr:glycosyltransferase [Methylobacter sp.]MCL7421336.1 glycosyltransferase [Methylobacter sp.]
MTDTIKIASLPGWSDPYNPYVDLFYGALAHHGIELADELKMDIDWLRENGNHLDGIHLHWPEVLWRSFKPTKPNRIRLFLRNKVPGAWRLIKYTDQIQNLSWYQKFLPFGDKIKGLLYFRKFLAIVRQLKIRIIWTLHNVESHEGHDVIDRLGYHCLSKAADLIIFHSEISKNEFKARYRLKARSVIMPHGNYDGVYPAPRPRKTVLEETGLRHDLPIVSCLGMLRNYKGLDIACEAIAELNGEVQFLCAGSPHSSFNIDALLHQINKLPHAVLLPRFLSEQEFADYVSISDALLLPYRKITGSGALLAALTLSKGVIASDLPYFQEVLGKKAEAGVLVPPENASVLAENIREYLSIPAGVRNQAARCLAEQYNWAKVVAPVVEIIIAWHKHAA